MLLSLFDVYCFSQAEMNKLNKQRKKKKAHSVDNEKLSITVINQFVTVHFSVKIDRKIHA